MTEKRGGRESQSSRSMSLGGLDPRTRRQPQSATTDLDLQAPLSLGVNGKIGLALTGALGVDSTGNLILRVSNGLKISPGSPISIQLDLDADDSVQVTKEGKVRARPKASHVIIDGSSSLAGHRTLAETISQDLEMVARKGQPNGYAQLDSSGLVPSSILPATPIPATIQIVGIHDVTYDLPVLYVQDSGSGAAANYLTVVNSDTTTPVLIQSDGTDSNISINIKPKGSGQFQVNSSRVWTVADAPKYSSLEFYQQTTAANPDQCYIANCRTGVTLTTVALNTNRLYWVPFIAPARGSTLADVRIQVTTAVASTSVIVGLYDCVSNGSGGPDTGDYRPNGSPISSATQSVAATGSFTLAVTASLTGGRLYWLAVLSQGAPTIRGVTSNQVDMTLGYNLPTGTAVPVANTHWYETRTYSLGLPTKTGTETYTNGTGAYPALFYTLST